MSFCDDDEEINEWETRNGQEMTILVGGHRYTRKQLDALFKKGLER